MSVSSASAHIPARKLRVSEERETGYGWRDSEAAGERQLDLKRERIFQSAASGDTMARKFCGAELR